MTIGQLSAAEVAEHAGAIKVAIKALALAGGVSGVGADVAAEVLGAAGVAGIARIALLEVDAAVVTIRDNR